MYSNDFLCMFMSSLLPIFVICQFTPLLRYYQTSVLRGSKFYVLGVIYGNNFACTNEVIYIDLSKKFEIRASPWNVALGTPDKGFLATLINPSSLQMISMMIILLSDLAILDTNVSPYKWSAPNITSAYASPSLCYHYATLYNGIIRDKPIPTPGTFTDDIPSYYANTDVIPTLGANAYRFHNDYAQSPRDSK
ncbi:hypothetical protein C2G38_2173696 [Gigaspora rosea]|uniref:Uncharacterized protein n=1 Tax=Gigaspora rosea TaxID=44941 RepID=A0A397VRI3_9GLOM|nr:hypothetical protein C2G38_2173696 [Gigaspora rosea]